jgi:hypothetical protein
VEGRTDSPFAAMTGRMAWVDRGLAPANPGAEVHDLDGVRPSICLGCAPVAVGRQFGRLCVFLRFRAPV